jgi:hypothetical protein
MVEIHENRAANAALHDGGTKVAGTIEALYVQQRGSGWKMGLTRVDLNRN